jgi:hypothetical protein
LKENGFEDLIRQRVKGGHGGKELSVVTAKEYESLISARRCSGSQSGYPMLGVSSQLPICFVSM